jgi:integrase
VGIGVALPKQPKATNHRALPYADVAAFLEKLRRSTASVSVKLVMEFTILTGVRTSEALKAEWGEVDLEKKLCSIPAERMKMDEPHQVPLSARAMEILEEAKTIRDGRMVFPSSQKDVPLSKQTMLRALQRMEGYEDMTVHGFRSCLKKDARSQTAPKDAEDLFCHWRTVTFRAFFSLTSVQLPSGC